jgi:hypothetical protein
MHSSWLSRVICIKRQRSMYMVFFPPLCWFGIRSFCFSSTRYWRFFAFYFLPHSDSHLSFHWLPPLLTILFVSILFLSPTLGKYTSVCISTAARKHRFMIGSCFRTFCACVFVCVAFYILGLILLHLISLSCGGGSGWMLFVGGVDYGGGCCAFAGSNFLFLSPASLSRAHSMM